MSHSEDSFAANGSQDASDFARQHAYFMCQLIPVELKLVALILEQLTAQSVLCCRYLRIYCFKAICLYSEKKVDYQLDTGAPRV